MVAGPKPNFDQLTVQVSNLIQHYAQMDTTPGFDNQRRLMLAAVSAAAPAIGVLAYVFGRECPTDDDTQQIIHRLFEEVQSLPIRKETDGSQP